MLLLVLFLYLSLYTWNLRTGYLDELASYSGLEIVGWTLLPGKWLKSRVSGFLVDYVYLSGVQQENEELHKRLERMAATLARSKEEAAEVGRLRALLGFESPEPWQVTGARVLSYRFGAQSALETILVDKGENNGLDVNMPAVTSQCVVGRVFKTGLEYSLVLLLTDRNSRMSVMGQTSRSFGVLQGRGIDQPLEVGYIPLNSRMQEGEILVTSGLDEIFPKGLPVARVEGVVRPEDSLFLQVKASVLQDFKSLEEILVLVRGEVKTGIGAAPLALP